MRNIILVIILVFLSAQKVMAEDCKCIIVPFKPDPPCFKICATRLINKAAIEEMELIIGLDKDVAQRIAKKSESPVESIDIYKQVLSEKEFQTLENKIRSLSQSQVKYLMQPVSERRAVVKSFRELNRM